MHKSFEHKVKKNPFSIKLREAGVAMSRRKKRKEERAPMPAQSAGLLRFFEEETEGIKVKPELLMVSSIVFIIICMVAHLYASGFF